MVVSRAPQTHTPPPPLIFNVLYHLLNPLATALCQQNIPFPLNTNGYPHILPLPHTTIFNNHPLPSPLDINSCHPTLSQHHTITCGDYSRSPFPYINSYHHLMSSPFVTTSHNHLIQPPLTTILHHLTKVNGKIYVEEAAKLGKLCRSGRRSRRPCGRRNHPPPHDPCGAAAPCVLNAGHASTRYQRIKKGFDKKSRP